MVRSTVALLAMMAMLLTGLTVAAPPAEAGNEYLGSGVHFDGTNYFCDGELAIVSTSVNFKGTDGDDVMVAMGADGQTVTGGGGNDTICVLTPGAFIYGGPGNDLIYTADVPAGYNASSYNVTTTTWAGPGRDYVKGGSAPDNISGGEDPDMLRGGGGFDYIWGGPGRDFIDGGGNRAIPFQLGGTVGDWCQDWEAPLGDYGMNCERITAMADSTPMPGVPDEGAWIPGHGKGNSTFR